MQAFLTGSRVYGTPREDSDIDLVVLVEPQEADLFWKLGKHAEGSCRFGNLNLIIFTRPERFEEWKKVTESLKEKAPVSREEAIKAFQSKGFGDYPVREPEEFICPGASESGQQSEQ